MSHDQVAAGRPSLINQAVAEVGSEDCAPGWDAGEPPEAIHWVAAVAGRMSTMIRTVLLLALVGSGCNTPAPATKPAAPATKPASDWSVASGKVPAAETVPVDTAVTIMTAASDTCWGDSNRLANLAVASKDPVAIADYASQALAERKLCRLIEAALKTGKVQVQ